MPPEEEVVSTLVPGTWNPKRECMGSEARLGVQRARLILGVHKLWDACPFYRARLEGAGVRPGQIRELEDLRRLPFTTRAEIANTPPEKLFAVSLDRVVRLHGTSGTTTGRSAVIAYTRADLELWAELTARALFAFGVRPGVSVQIALNYGMFTGAFGFHQGAEKIGAAVIPSGGGGDRRQLQLMRALGSQVFVATPSYALHLAEVAEAEGIDLRALPVCLGIFGAEPWSEAMREEIQRRFGIRAQDTYGLTEVIGPGVAHECPAGRLHVNEDHFLPEIIDPATGRALPEGDQGELVITALTKEAVPLIRYRTGDRTALTRGRCPCGRTLVQMERVAGRVDDMLIVRGVNVFPSQVENVLMGFRELNGNFRLVVSRGTSRLDEAVVQVEHRPGANERALGERIRRGLREDLGLRVIVELLPPGSLPRSRGGKARRVFDHRDL